MNPSGQLFEAFAMNAHIRGNGRGRPVVTPVLPAPRVPQKERPNQHEIHARNALQRGVL
jgi:hypothetical protein